MKKFVEKIVPRIRGVLTPVRAVVIIAVVALFWFLVLGDQGIYQFRQLMEMKHRFLAERSKINEEIDSLTKEREMLRNPENLEMIIRSELGYIRPGEILFEEKPAEKQ
jgi:cell division protein FtsB